MMVLSEPYIHLNDGILWLLIRRLLFLSSNDGIVRGGISWSGLSGRDDVQDKQ